MYLHGYVSPLAIFCGGENFLWQLGLISLLWKCGNLTGSVAKLTTKIWRSATKKFQPALICSWKLNGENLTGPVEPSHRRQWRPKSAGQQKISTLLEDIHITLWSALRLWMVHSGCFGVDINKENFQQKVVLKVNNVWTARNSSLTLRLEKLNHSWGENE